ncbi:Lsr2 family protein [Rhodococcus sp. WS4]|nr:Lsr2 family protein [Rhodococcus sp. WS4]
MGTLKGRYMATKIEKRLIDDIDQSDAVSTIAFSVGKQHFEIDLSEEHVDEFNKDLKKWIDHARKVPAARRRSGKASYLDTIPQAEVRKWARATGLDVAERGRIAEEIYDQYREAHNL